MKATLAALACGLAAGIASGAVAHAAGIVVTSPAFADGGRIPQRYAAVPCGGANVAPPLHWRGVPAFSRSLALSIYDADGRSGAGFWHWFVYDIPPSVMGIDASVGGVRLPPGAEVGKNDAMAKHYFGPCPPRGRIHHYSFTVYALSQAYVQAKRNLGALVILQRMDASILARGTLHGTYGR